MRHYRARLPASARAARVALQTRRPPGPGQAPLRTQRAVLPRSGAIYSVSCT